VAEAARLLEAGRCDGALVLAVEIFEECSDLYARHRRFYRWPLVETVACLWLEPGAGELQFESGRSGGPGRRAPDVGERFAAAPLADLSERWRDARAGALELSGRWRGEHARLRWSMVTSHARGSAA